MAVVVPYKIDWTYRNAILTLLALDVVQAGGSVPALDQSAGETHPNWLVFLNQIIAATNALGATPPLPTYSELDRNGFQNVVNSIASAVIVQPPTNTVAPLVTIVTGGDVAGSAILTCNNGTWTGSPTYTRQWMSNAAPIIGATGVVYQSQAADSGQSITCQVTATNVAGFSTATSNAIALQ